MFGNNKNIVELRSRKMKLDATKTQQSSVIRSLFRKYFTTFIWSKNTSQKTPSVMFLRTSASFHALHARTDQQAKRVQEN